MNKEESKNSKKSIWEKKYFWPVLILIFSIFIRFIHYYNIKNYIWFTTPVLDAEIYHNWALSILEGDWLSRNQGVLFMSPGYPYLLAIIYLILGIKVSNVVFLNYIIGSLTCVLMYFIGKRVFNKSVGIIAALVGAIYGIFIFYESFILSFAIINFFNLLVILLFIYLLEKKDRINLRLFLIGLLVGLSALFRPNILLFIFFIIGYLWIWSPFKKHNKEHLIRYSISLCLGVIIMVIPITLRNYIVGKEFVLITASSGPNFYIGNNSTSSGTYTWVDSISPDSFGKDFRALASKKTNKSLNYSESSNYWFSQGIEFIKTRPDQWFKLMLRKFLYFWNKYEFPGNINYYYIKKEFKFPFNWLLSYIIIAPLGLVGLILSYKKEPKKIVLYLYLLTYLISNMMFFVLAEYRGAIIPIIIIFASAAVYLIKTQTNYKRFVLSSGLIVIAIIFVNVPLPKGMRESAMAMSHYSFGGIYKQKKHYDEAIEEYKKAIEIEHEDIFFNNLGTVYERKKLFRDAVNSYKRAIEINPDSAIAAYNLARVYFLEKKYKNAELYYRQAIENNPVMEETHYNLGNLYVEMKLYEKAIIEYRKALAINPKYKGIYTKIAELFEKSGKYNEAIQEYKKAIEIDPTYLKAYNNLGIVYCNKKDYEKAFKVFSKALEINPESQAAKKNYQQLERIINSKKLQK
ncbi:tetratricopeptide repeat protein [Elusimicrobiota bacterium]